LWFIVNFFFEGQWGEVGIATEYDIPGLKTMSNLQCVKGLEYVMNSHRLQTCVSSIESYVLLGKIAPQVSVNLDEKIWKKSVETSGTIVRVDDFWRQYEANQGDKVFLFKTYLKAILKSTLKMDDSDDIDDNANLQDLGVDSLLFVEIKNSLQELLGSRCVISINAIRSSNTVNLLAEAVVKLIDETKM